ncbi:MAG: cell wall metabolism sensor histidine kinase WalK [Actinobacteria bacterium]|nr:MAG: cell wall metabolism sensor histidine kinase WalK [Actinomycetota bacterium]
MMALSRPAGLLAASQRAINRVLFLVTLAAAALAAALAWLLSGRVTGPISALTRAARQVRSGDLHARATIEVPDEVGTLGEAFNDMADSLIRMTGDLREAAEEEANLRVRIESVMQSIGDALVATDGKGDVVAVNRAAETMFGRSDGTIVGKHLSEVLKGADAEGRTLADLALGGNGASVQAMVVSADGRHLPIALSGSPLRDASGQTVGRVVLLRDVTREQEAERMKSEFLSNVSHELRTPLTPIKGYTEILLRKRFPRDKTEAFLDGIAQSTKRLERIVEILVDFAALEAGRLKPRVQPVDVRAFTAGVVDRWKGMSDRHKIVRKVPAGLPPVLGDERLLRKLIDELMDNAIKFSPAGGTIEISANAVAATGRRRGISGVRITVRDPGIGIEESQMGRLFQDFRQLDGSETRSFGGLGLGLSYARRVAQAHHGDITATSQAGRGSEFSLLLPAAQQLHSAKPPRDDAKKRKGFDRPKPIRRTRPVTAPRTTSGRKKVAAAKAVRRKKPSR